MSTALQLPELKRPAPGTLREIVVVTHGLRGGAELDALQAMLQFTELKIANLKYFEGETVWKAADSGEWSGKLVAAALSRSNTMQGGALLDGRTQDIYGLGLLPTLAKNPRATVIMGQFGMRATILALDGAIEDTTLAFTEGNGVDFSTLLYRPPAPNREEFSGLAAALEHFFNSGKFLNRSDRIIFVADFFERFRSIKSH